VRTVLDHIGKDGWELAGVHPLWPAETSYMIFKRPATGSPSEQAPAAEEGPDQSEKKETTGEPTRDISEGSSEMV